MTTATVPRPRLPERRSGDGPAEWALAARAQAGDPQAWATLYDRYRHTLHQFIARRTRSHSRMHADVEDLVHDVFIRALGRSHQLQYDGRAFGAYLTTVARNLLVDRWKSAWIQRSSPVAEFIAELDAADLADPSAEVVHAELTRILRDALLELTGPQRQVIEARFFTGLSVRETAQLLGIEEGAVKAAQYRAVRALARNPHVMEVLAR